MLVHCGIGILTILCGFEPSAFTLDRDVLSKEPSRGSQLSTILEAYTGAVDIPLYVPLSTSIRSSAISVYYGI